MLYKVFQGATNKERIENVLIYSSIAFLMHCQSISKLLTVLGRDIGTDVLQIGAGSDTGPDGIGLSRADVYYLLILLQIPTKNTCGHAV